MSQSSAIASVTAALFHLLDSQGIVTTTIPPNEVNAGASDQINLYLYGTEVNPAFRNEPMPGATLAGQSGPPPLALNLRYLISAYGDNNDFSVHELMGQAMLVLHDNTILNQAQISGLVPDAGLADQIEKIKITPVPLSLDDMSKLWTSFQTEYRLSAAYEISVVLIESGKPINTPLPVIKRGDQDQGVTAVPSPSPSISGFRFANQKPAAELGDTVTVLGENLAGTGIKIRFEHPDLDNPIELDPGPGSSEFEITVVLPNLTDDPEAGDQWPAGFYSVSLVTKLPNTPAWASNKLSMPLSPMITSRNPSTAPAGAISVDVECMPRIKTGQRVALIFANQSLSADTVNTPADKTLPTTLQFNITNTVARPTPYVLRLRINGVDSIPVDFSNPIPVFTDNQKLEIT